jgi:hypothetical protein
MDFVNHKTHAMLKIYIPVLALCALTSCGFRIAYLGNTSTPTSQVDVYVDASSIKKPYVVVGKGYVEKPVGPDPRIEKIQESAIRKAKEKGADAVLFQDYYNVLPVTTSSTVAHTDSTGTRVTSNSGPVISSGRNIIFLKYQ